MGSTRLFLLVLLFSAVLFAGCVSSQNPAERQVQSSENALELERFVETQEELDAFDQESFSESEKKILEANQAYLDFIGEAGKLNNLAFDCANFELYQKNLDTLQNAIDVGLQAAGGLGEGKKTAWNEYFFGLQMEKDSAQSDLDELCGEETNS
ncbi:MAG: hypothetical protein QXR53_01305 [Candidatus Norongarragalinales archaeon]